MLSPVFVDAHLVSKDRFKAGLGYSALGYALDGNRAGYLNSFDAQLHYGLSDRVNIIGRFQQSWFASALFRDPAMSFLFAGPNIRLRKERVSLFIPVGTRFTTVRGDGTYFEFSPTLLFSIPLLPGIAFNPAAELNVPVCSSCSGATTLSADLGLALYPAKRISLTVEYDLVYQIEAMDEGHYYMLNLGAAVKLGSPER